MMRESFICPRLNMRIIGANGCQMGRDHATPEECPECPRRENFCESAFMSVEALEDAIRKGK